MSEAAAKLGVSRISVWRWIRDGELPAVRLGSRITRIAEEDLDSILVSLRPSGRLPRRDLANGSGELDELDPREHLVQFYERDQALFDAVAGFMRGGLEAGGAGVVVATKAHRAGIQKALRAVGIDLDGARRSGRYRSLDALTTLSSFMVNGVPDRALYYDVIGGLVERVQKTGQPVKVFGEMVALLALEGNETATIALEELWNQLQATHKFQLFCGYPMKALADDSVGLLEQVCAAHTRARPTESFTRLTGEQEQIRAIVSLQHRIAVLERDLAASQEIERDLRGALQRERHARHSPEAEFQRQLDLLGSSASGPVPHAYSQLRDSGSEPTATVEAHIPRAQKEVAHDPAQ